MKLGEYLPDGYRELNIGEHLEDGDLYFRFNRGEWLPYSAIRTEKNRKRYNPEKSGTLIRKINSDTATVN